MHHGFNMCKYDFYILFFMGMTLERCTTTRPFQQNFWLKFGKLEHSWNRVSEYDFIVHQSGKLSHIIILIWSKMTETGHMIAKHKLKYCGAGSDRTKLTISLERSKWSSKKVFACLPSLFGLVTCCVSHRVCSLSVWEGKCSSQEDTRWWVSAVFYSRWRSRSR